MTNLKKNISASIKARLLNLSKANKQPFQELLQYYGIERFLFRLSNSIYKKRFILKGALLLKVWNINAARSTVDIDLSAQTSNSIDNLIKITEDVCACDYYQIDGLIFNPNTINGEVIQIQREYQGIRIQFEGKLNSAKIPMQIDFGFGDIVTPSPQNIIFPVLLDHPTFHFQGYPPETVIAEKLQTMFEKGLLNSRLKDYYDVWVLSRWFKFNSGLLTEAVEKTFNQRNSPMQITKIIELIDSFGMIKEHQFHWERFCKKKFLLDLIPPPLKQVCQNIIDFIYETLTIKI